MSNWRANLWRNKWWSLMFMLLMLILLACMFVATAAIIEVGAYVVAGVVGGIVFLIWCGLVAALAKMMLTR